jgi:transcriptional regulator with GAF, ATPase, and Fis domain/multidrug resistance efflux pump
LNDPVVMSPLADFSATLLAELEMGPRARILARSIADIAPGSAILVYAAEDDEAVTWTLKAIVGELSVDRGAIAVNSGTLGAVAKRRVILRLSAEGLTREDYAHLDVRQSFTALTYVPIMLDEQLLGCVEIVSFSEPPTEALLGRVARMADYAAIAFGSSLAYEAERNASLSSVMRLTQLYDIEKVFNATLELQTLLPVICSKIQDLTGATGVNLWMFDEKDLLLMQQAGEDPGAKPGDRQDAGGGIVGDVGETGEAVLFQADEEPLQKRNLESAGAEAISLMAVALLSDESLIGVLEVVSYYPELRFNEDDLFTLTQVAASAAQALHNSSLLQAERKIEVLQTLVSVSQEITSTLNLQRVLETIVTQPQLVIPYERAAIALEQRNRLTVQAISGVSKVDASNPDVQKLNGLLSWAAGLETEVYVSQHGDEISDPRPETREKFLRYFEITGSRSFYAIPLKDDEGRLGILSFESSDPDFLTDLHIEIIKILASQATLALRNASLYKEVPFIGIIEPLIEKKRRFMMIDKRRRAVMLTLTAVVLLALILVPFPMRISGQAQVAPSQTEYVRAEEDGVVQKVLVVEGEQVMPDTPLLQMTDWGQRAALAGAQAKYNTATAQMTRALVNNDATTAGQRQLEADYLRGEMTRSSEHLSRMTLHSEITGVVATPHVENLTGKKVSTGDPIMELVNTGNIIVDVALSERDIGLLKIGAPASIKLESFPTSTFHGTVSVISPSGQAVDDGHVFFARITVPNTDGDIKPGMQGFSKIRVGTRPLGYVLFRDVAIWVWSKLWNWFSW